MSSSLEIDPEDLDTGQLILLLGEMCGVSRPWLEARAERHGVSVRYLCLMLLKPVGRDDARVPYFPDRIA